MVTQESLASSMMFAEFIVAIAAIYIFSALGLGLMFTVMQKVRDRRRGQLSDKYTAAFAVIYIVERLHGRRMQDSRDKVLQKMWASDPDW